MLMDPHTAKHHAGPQHVVLRPQQEVTRLFFKEQKIVKFTKCSGLAFVKGQQQIAH